VTPFDRLRRPSTPQRPEARFAELLRSQIAAALEPVASTAAAPVAQITIPERRTTMSSTSSTAVTAGSPAVSPALSITPYLCVADASAAIDWYASVFGATEAMRYVGDDGRIGHAEILVGGARLMLSDPYPDFGVDAPVAGALASVTMNLDVADVDAVVDDAGTAGATVVRVPEDQGYGDRAATIIDPFGHRWMLHTKIATPTAAEINESMEGFTVVEASAADAAAAPVELGYLVLPTADTARATAFFGALFGWVSEAGNMGDGYAHVDNTKLPMGFTPDGVDKAPSLYFRVDNVERYAVEVERLGGTVLSRNSYESGANAACVDDQGREFELWQPAPGY